MGELGHGVSKMDFFYKQNKELQPLQPHTQFSFRIVFSLSVDHKIRAQIRGEKIITKSIFTFASNIVT
jgi:hypothetical protein